MNPKFAKTVFNFLFLLALLLIPAGLGLAVFLSCTAGFAGFLTGGALILLLLASAAIFSERAQTAAETLREQNAPYHLQ